MFGPLCFRGLRGAINSLLLVLEARDTFITSVLRYRLFNLKKESSGWKSPVTTGTSLQQKHIIVYLSILPSCQVYCVWNEGEEVGKGGDGGVHGGAPGITNTSEKLEA